MTELPTINSDEKPARRSIAKLVRDTQYEGMTLDQLSLISAIHRSSVEIALITFGSKEIHVSVTKDGDFVTYIRRDENPKVEGDTTECYMKVRELIQDFADKEKKTMRYSLNTQSDKIANWATTKGREIFHWDSEVILPYPDSSIFQANVQPNE